MLAIVLSSTTISCAIEMITSAQPRWVWPPFGWDSSSMRGSVVSDIGFLGVGRVHRGRHDDLVDDAGDGVLVRCLAEDVETVQADAGQRGAEEAGVEILSDLSALLGP